MGRGTRDLQINNPRETARVNPELLEALTIGRDEQLSKVVSALREFAAGKKANHFVFIGPRGAGKTHMLMMVKRRIETDVELRKWLMPAEYPEETYAVMSEADFVKQTVEAVCQADEHAEAMMDVMPWEREGVSEEETVRAGLKGLRDYCLATKRRLVLLVDNLDTVLEKTDGLANVMKEGFLCIVGGAIGRVEGVWFSPLVLEDLSLEDAERLWKRLRELDEEKGTAVSAGVGRACPGPPEDEAGVGTPALQKPVEEWWEEVGPRWKAIYELSGGNPRIVLMLYRAFEEGDVEDVRFELSRLVDESTPYFKAITESLPDTDRKVLSAIVNLGERVRPIEIEEATGIEERTLRLSVARLRETGLVRAESDDGATLYSLRQRFYRTWLRMRMASGTRFETLWFVDLLRILYSDPQRWFEARLRFACEYEKAVEVGAAAEAQQAKEMRNAIAAAIPMGEIWGEWNRLLEREEYEGIRTQAEEVAKAASETGQSGLGAAAHSAAGVACALLGHLIEAVEAYEEAARLKPDFAEVHYTLGVTYRALGRHGEALRSHLEAIRVKPDYAKAHHGLGVLYEELDRYEEAVEEFREATRLEPDSAEPHFRLGLACLASGQPEEAAQALRRATTLKPESEAAYLMLGVACAELGGDKESVEAFRHAMTLKRDSPDAHLLLGLAHLLVRRCVEAGKHLDEAAALLKKEGRKLEQCWALAAAAGAWAEAGDVGRADAGFREGLGVLAGVGTPALQGRADPQEQRRLIDEITWGITEAMRQRWMGVVKGWVEEGVRVMPEARGFFEPFGWAVDYFVKGAKALVRRNDEEVRAVQVILERAGLKEQAEGVGKILERRMSGAAEVKPRKARKKKVEEWEA
jgi:tetratricopeptide (TPR) repeat protein/DNA-binding transcriptional ArsR family regulator